MSAAVREKRPSQAVDFDSASDRFIKLDEKLVSHVSSTRWYIRKGSPLKRNMALRQATEYARAAIITNQLQSEVEKGDLRE